MGDVAGSEGQDVGRALGERMKELVTLHSATRTMLDVTRPLASRLAEVAALLPSAMQHPELATACIDVGADSFATPGHAAGPWLLAARFRTATGESCFIEVAYREQRSFLVEEQALVDTLAELIRNALDRDAADLEVRRVRDRLNFALHAAGMGVWEWDLATGRVFWSEHLAAMSGIAVPERAHAGQHEHLVHEDDREALGRAARRVAEGGSSVEALDVRIRRPDGSWRPVQVFAHRPEHGRVIAVFVDVTVRQSLETALRAAQKLEALGQVAGGVAHDFNNVLAVIIANAEALSADVPPGGELHEIARDIHTAGMRGVGLTQQLLSFSRSGGFEPAAVDVNAAIRTLEPILVRLVKGRAKLTVELDAAVGRIWADPTHIEQVVMNLVVNARDAIEKTGAIVVSTSRADGDESVPGYTVIGVRDNGPGIGPELRARIFEPFFTTKAPGKGTGLGLAVVTNVARQWRGRVTLESTPGSGATFRVFLPQHAP